MTHSKKISESYTFTKPEEKINHLMYMDDINVFTKKDNEPETLIQLMRIYSQDIAMEVSIEKRVMIIM